MSAEGKKKRGESGLKNAQSMPFRGKGYPPGYTLSTAIRGTNSPYGAGSLLVRAMALGVMLPGFNPSQRLVDHTDRAMERCTSPVLT